MTDSNRAETSLKIVKPEVDPMDKFKAKRSPTIAGVETVLTPLPLMRLGQVGDFFRLYPSEEIGWTEPLCFVSVPVHGAKEGILHLIDEELAAANLAPKKIKRWRLAFAAKPNDVFFLAIIPCENLDNPWNKTAMIAVERAKKSWVEMSSRKKEGKEEYKVDNARDFDAFVEPNWPLPKRVLWDLIAVTLNGAMIEDYNHPGLCRLMGRKQDLT